MRLPQFQHLLFDLGTGLVRIPPRCPAPFHQPFDSCFPIAPQPYIAGLARDLISLAQLLHRALMLLVLEDKPQLLFHHTALSPWHALKFYLRAMFFAVSGISPVYSVRHAPGLYPRSSPPPPALIVEEAV